MPKYYSPLRYPGGKAKLADYIKTIFEDNLLIGGTYAEPYCGGASVALELLLEEYVSKILINDFDRSIYAFWYSVLEDTETMCQLIYDTPINITTWEKLRRIQQNKEKVSLLQLGFSTFYLNRTNRSGVLKAGVIGGKNQNGNYSIDARFNKADLIERIKRIASFKSRIELYQKDACEFLKSMKNLPKNSLIYLDPPYYVKGKDLYVNHYSHNDHEIVAEIVKAIRNRHWIVSYDNVSQIGRLYGDYRKIEYSFNYSLINGSKGSEVIFFNDDLIIPQVMNPITMV